LVSNEAASFCGTRQNSVENVAATFEYSIGSEAWAWVFDPEAKPRGPI